MESANEDMLSNFLNNIFWGFLVLCFLIIIYKLKLLLRFKYFLLINLFTLNPRKYMAALDTLIRKEKIKTNFEYFTILKMRGLSSLGDWDAFEKYSSSLDQNSFTEYSRIHYYHILISALFHFERIEEAQELFYKERGLLQKDPKFKYNRYLNAINYYYSGDLEKSKEILHELYLECKKQRILKIFKLKNSLAVIKYYLGLINLKQGEETVAKSHFQEAKKLSKGCFIEKKIEKLNIDI